MRAPAPAPPKGWRPKALTLRQKLDAALNQLGMLGVDIEWQHFPPIQMRVWNPDTQDTEPPANDPRFIVPMVKADHREQTAKVDIPQIAKTKRMAAEQEEFRKRILSRECGEPRKPKGTIKSRGFKKGKT